MNMKKKVAASLLLLASVPTLANIAQCCYEIRQIKGNRNMFCESEQELAAMIGEDFSQRNYEAFGVSRKTRRLPIPGETNSDSSQAMKPIQGIQNVGYLLTPKANQSLKAVVPAFKHKSVATGSECVSVEISKLDDAYVRFGKLEQTSNLRQIGATENSCLLAITNINSILSTSAHREQLKNSLKRRNIHLLNQDQASLAQATVTVDFQDMSWGANQYDLSYKVRKPLFAKFSSAEFKTNMTFDYGRYRTQRVKFENKISLETITYNDQLDVAVLSNTISQQLNVNTCLSNR